MNNNIKETTSLVFVRGKNLFNKNAVLKNYELTNNGVSVSYNNLWFVSDYIEVKPNTTYYLSGNRTGGTTIAFYDENTNFISYVSKITGDITTPSNAKYMRFNGKQSEIDNNIMLEHNSVATEYEPYIKKQIQIKNKNGVFEKFLEENAIIPFNLSVNYTSDVQNCFAVDNIVNINLNTFNSNGFTRDAWTIIATIPAGYRPSKDVYISAYGSDGGWTSPVAVPVMINTSGEILVFLKTTVKRILISSSYLQ